jgi:hypothetical protein
LSAKLFIEITEMVEDSEICKVEAYLQPLIGKQAWGVSLGIGSFLTVEFGEPVVAKQNSQRLHGEWHLWIYCCAWRLEADDHIMAASEDSRSKIESSIQTLNKLLLLSVQVFPPAWDAVFRFEKNIVLRLFSIHSEECDHWMLYTPNGNVLTLGSGSNWSYKSSSTD